MTLDLGQFADGCKNSLTIDLRHCKSTPLVGQFQLQMKKTLRLELRFLKKIDD